MIHLFNFVLSTALGQYNVKWEDICEVRIGKGMEVRLGERPRHNSSG
jgi:hypothetical protein